jgi:hypothetical protein
MTCDGRPQGVGAGPTTDRRKDVQCFFMNAAPGASCPATDEVSLSALSDLNQSCGFTIDFVIEAAETNALPAACEDLLRCCALLDGTSGRRCSDELDARNPPRADWCESQLDYQHSQARCQGITAAPTDGVGVDGGVGDGGVSDGGEAVASQGPAHVQCCYQVCGYGSCI